MKEELLWLLLTIFLNVKFLNGNTCKKVFAKIPYSGYPLLHHLNINHGVLSIQDCAQYCENYNSCQSVGFSPLQSMCILYNHRAYTGRPDINSTVTDFIYYWRLVDTCPIDLGYKEEPHSKICTKSTATRIEWIQARDACNNEGGHLFMIDRPEKQPIVDRYADETELYVGSTSTDNLTVWYWFNGIQVGASQFTPYEPSSYDRTDKCMTYQSVTFFGSLLEGLNDVRCTHKYGYICEIPTIQAYRLYNWN